MYGKCMRPTSGADRRPTRAETDRGAAEHRAAVQRPCRSDFGRLMLSEGFPDLAHRSCARSAQRYS